MMKNDTADQNQPFVLKSTVGIFLNSVSFFFMLVAFGFALLGSPTVSTNRTVVIFLLDAIIIQILLAMNSRLFFSIFAFLTFGSIMMQIFCTFYSLFATTFFDGMATTHVVLMTLYIFAILTFMIGVQVFCSAAMLKLGGVPPLPKPVKKSKQRHHKKRSEKVRNEEKSTKSSEKSEIGTKTSERGSVPSMTPSCSHDHTCSTFGNGSSTRSS